MRPPMDTPSSMWSLMMKCWSAIPEQRPRFNEIIMEIDRPFDKFSDAGGYVSLHKKI